MASMKDSAGNLKGTNIPYDSINANRRDEIGRIIVDAIAIGNWRSANDQLFKAAYWSNVGREQGQGGGNPDARPGHREGRAPAGGDSRRMLAGGRNHG